MGFLFGLVVGYLICRYQAKIWKFIQDKFDGDDGNPPAFV
jgi:hypothetical protein